MFLRALPMRVFVGLKKKKPNEVSFYSSGCPRTHYISQAGLTLLVGLASISQMLRLQAQAGPELTLQPSLALNSW